MPLLHSQLRDMLSELGLHLLIMRKRVVKRTFTKKKPQPMGSTIHCEPGKYPEYISYKRPRGEFDDHR